MAPLENGGFQPSVWDGDRSRPIDSLMRALLYIAQQVGRPLSEADVRRLAAVPAAGLADRCLIQVAYAIGVADPMSLYVDTQGTGKVDERKLEKVLNDIFPLRPTNIRRSLQLNKPIYQRTAAYGHFGRKPEKDGGFSWERTDLVAELKRAFGAR